jgi:hypothetical protein
MTNPSLGATNAWFACFKTDWSKVNKAWAVKRRKDLKVDKDTEIKRLKPKQVLLFWRFFLEIAERDGVYTEH